MMFSVSFKFWCSMVFRNTTILLLASLNLSELLKKLMITCTKRLSSP